MKIHSPAFSHGESIPIKYSRDAEDRPPPLEFADIPPEARSLVLIVDDPDAPRGTFTHWIVFNLEPDVGGLAENRLPDGVCFGLNDWGEAGYGGPRPPDKEHRYFFRLYALDEKLAVSTGSTRRQIELAMEKHVVGNAELMGRFAPQPVSTT